MLCSVFFRVVALSIAVTMLCSKICSIAVIITFVLNILGVFWRLAVSLSHRGWTSQRRLELVHGVDWHR